MKDGETRRQCDDCCDVGQVLKEKIKFFGATHDMFWPCANGMISFKGQVETYTPKEFPIAGQPVVAAFWGDVDLRRCRPDLNMRCSYFKVFYGDDANFLNGKITQDYMSGEQTFKAKVAIVQTWDKVGYYDRRTNKGNTFQIVIVSDGGPNTFAGLYYDKIEWTTGDDSSGTNSDGKTSNAVNGLGGIQAQMGFDNGMVGQSDKDGKSLARFYAHPWSRKENMIDLGDKEFIFAISALKICGAGEELVGEKCIARSCTVRTPFPIKDVNGQSAKLDNGNTNANYVKPPVLVGTCANLKADGKLDKNDKAKNGAECYLKCEYDTAKGITYQPKNTGNLATTNKGVAAKCNAAVWEESAAKSCVEVGIQATVQNADGSGKLKVTESDAAAQTIYVSLKSKPYTTGTASIDVVVQTSCKNGAPLQSEMQGSENKYFCKDDKDDADKKTDPLAKIVTDSNQALYVNTLLFTKDNWNKPQAVKIKGLDNQEKSDNGFEKFKVFFSIKKNNDENCNSQGCTTSKPYNNLKPTSIDGELADNENLEIKQVNDKSLISDEDGKEGMIFLRPVIKGDKQYVGKKVSCTSSNQKEGKLAFYSEGDVAAYLANPSDASKLGEKKALQDGEEYTLTEKDVTFYIAGQPDEVVDGPINYKVECKFAESNLGTILPLYFVNEDRNVPGVVVDTSMSARSGGRLQTVQNGAGTYFEVKLATEPQGDVIVQAAVKRAEKEGGASSDKQDKDTVSVTPLFQKFTKADWNTPKRFTVEARSAAVLDAIFESADVLKETLSINVDTSATQDTGLSTFQASNNKYTHVLGYASCGPPVSGATAPAEGKLTAEELESARRQKPINCFNTDPTKITGKKDQVADKDELEIGVDVQVDKSAQKTAVATTSIVGGVIAAIIITLIVVAIAGALVAMAIKRKRGEEADRKADVKKGADKAEADISFRMDEMENARDMEDLEGTGTKLKGERDRLKDENQKLAAEVGEDPMYCADTEDNDALVTQIKGLKGENDRLREMQESSSNKRTRRNKKKADGFGQQQE